VTVAVLGSDTITRLRGQVRDDFGDWTGTDAELDIPGCSVQPTSAIESTDRGELLVTSLTAYCPPGTDLTATDRVRWLGSVYEVNGTPPAWRNRAGGVSHLIAELKLVQGQG
jgi:hypothetical protein